MGLWARDCGEWIVGNGSWAPAATLGVRMVAEAETLACRMKEGANVAALLSGGERCVCTRILG